VRLLPLTRALAVLATAVVLVPGPATAAVDDSDGVAVHPEWGSTAGHDARLHRGCRTYAYSYALTPPEGDWALETFLVGPRGKRSGSGYFLTGSDPLAGSGRWRLCLRSTRAGTYTIRARMTVNNAVDFYDGWLPDSTFRLTKPRR
jgi:hypothetical protein